MKRIPCLIIALLCPAIIAFASDAKKDDKKPAASGSICYAKCVDQTSRKATCDQHCTETIDEIVFINDKGQVNQIANPGVAKSICAKSVKMNTATQKEGDPLAISNVIKYRGP